MYNINWLFTQHVENGPFCNSLELYKIIEKIKPEIIFEELSCSNFNQFYEQNRRPTLEVNAVKEYLRIYKIQHIPVDTFPLPDAYEEERDQMLNKVYYDNNMPEKQTFFDLRFDHRRLVFQHGFRFLNSEENIKYMEAFNSLQEAILNKIGDENLFRIHQLNRNVIAKRDYQIIENIYNFSKENSFSTAIMFIGSGHTNIFNVINEFEKKQNIKLNWKNYFNQSLPVI